MNKDKFILNLLRTSNPIIMTFLFSLTWFFYYADKLTTKFFRLGDLFIIFVFFIVYSFFVLLYDGLNIVYNRVSDLIYSQIISILISDIFLYIIIFILNKGTITIMPLLIVLVLQTLIAILWSQINCNLYLKKHKPSKTIIIYDTRKEVKGLIESYGFTKRFDVQKTIKSEACLKKLEILKDYEVVFVYDLHSSQRNIIAKYCMANDIEMFVSPKIGDIIMSDAKEINIFHSAMKHLSVDADNLTYFIIKRIFDILISLIAIIITSPLMIITAIIIKAYDKGPVLYKQNRLTKNGKVFKLIKFRSMKINAEKESGAILSSGDNDPRITPIGKIIRKIRLDELPQLFNILKGDMSIVGPRPERPEIAQKYEKTLPEFKLRLKVKAGLTGYAQVYGKYNTTPYNKLKMDLIYISKMNVLFDLRICLATIKILFMPESTEGIETGKTTAMNEEGMNN